MPFPLRLLELPVDLTTLLTFGNVVYDLIVKYRLLRAVLRNCFAIVFICRFSNRPASNGSKKTKCSWKWRKMSTMTSKVEITSSKSVLKIAIVSFVCRKHLFIWYSLPISSLGVNSQLFVNAMSDKKECFKLFSIVNTTPADMLKRDLLVVNRAKSGQLNSWQLRFCLIVFVEWYY